MVCRVSHALIATALLAQVGWADLTAPTPAPDVNCAGEWGVWNDCSITCGFNGSSVRTFYHVVEASGGGSQCLEDDGVTERRDCGGEHCPIDCEGQWGEWGECSSSCGYGSQSRYFMVVQSAQYGGADCALADGWQDPRQLDCDCLPNCATECAIDCEGTWGAWDECSAVNCSEFGLTGREFTVTAESEFGGQDCEYADGQNDAEICFRACDTTEGLARTSTKLPAQQIDDSETTYIVSGIAAGTVVLVTAIAIGVACFWLARKRRLKRYLELDEVSDKNIVIIGHTPTPVRTEEVILSDIREVISANTSSWTTLEKLARLVGEFHGAHSDSQSSGSLEGDLPQEVRDSHVILQDALSENHARMSAAVREKDFRTIAVLNTQAETILAVLPAAAADAVHDSDLECVLPGLLLHKDRFDGGSEAFLGRGASGAVSRGVWVQNVGSTEIRTTVAVKEVQKTGASENRAMREFLLLSKKLQPQHPNIIRIYNIMSHSSTYFVVMEYCCFSVDKMPQNFQDFLHGYDSTNEESVPTQRRLSLANVGRIVLNALIQDLIRGASFLHSRQVAHCDIKPANVLVAFDRGGKHRDFKQKYFKQAQLKLTDFGVSRIIESQSHAENNHAETTATVSLSALKKTEGIAGSESYMSPEVLEIVRAIRMRELHHDPAITGQVLIANDAFGCGCVIGYLCSRGKHPFQSPVFKSIPDNILAGRRAVLTELGIDDPRHVTLVDKMTLRNPKSRWNPQKVLRQSAIFESTFSDEASILLDTIELHKKPEGSCRQQLLSEEMLSQYPRFRTMVSSSDSPCIDSIVEIVKNRHLTNQNQLDEDSIFAIVAYTFDNQVERTSNVYFALNKALRKRATNAEDFQKWQGFLYFLMRALKQLNKFQGLVFRGGNKGIDQRKVKKEYKLGRPVQWAAFSSSSRSEEASKAFVNKAKGVLFKITVVSGTDIGPYSYVPKEGEVLLSPNTRFTVTKELYKDDEGYSCVDLAESKGLLLSS